MTWPRYAIFQSEAQLALIISYSSYKSVNLWLKLVLVFYFKSLHRQEIDVKTGWGVNFSFGQDGGGWGGGGGGGVKKFFMIWGGDFKNSAPLKNILPPPPPCSIHNDDNVS